MMRTSYFLLAPLLVLVIRGWQVDLLLGVGLSAALLGVLWFYGFRVVSKENARLDREATHLAGLGRTAQREEPEDDRVVQGPGRTMLWLLVPVVLTLVTGGCLLLMLIDNTRAGYAGT